MAAALPYVVAAASAKTAVDATKQAKQSAGVQRQMIAQQEQTVARQERQLESQQSEMAQRATASIRARRGGGLRSLLSEARMDETGLPAVSKLGGD